MADVAVEVKATDELIAIVNKESAEAAVEQEKANEQAADTKVAVDAAEEMLANADRELAAAIPAMEAATAAAGNLTKDSLSIVKTLGTPHEYVKVVGKAAIILLKNEYKKTDWPNFTKMLGDPNKFRQGCIDFLQKAGNIPDKTLDTLKPILAETWFNAAEMKSKAEAAANLCDWVNNIVEYNRIYKIVTPLKQAAAEADATAKTKKGELEVVLEKVRVINERVDELKAQLAEAKAKLDKVNADAGALKSKLDVANRLVDGLADEKVRWEAKNKTLGNQKMTMIGDAIVSAAFVSYIGPFSADFRNDLWENIWLTDVAQKNIPFTQGVDPLKVLSNATDHATWSNQGLPADRVSLENAAIVCESTRYPLIIDPQLQGIKWIKGREGAEMQTMQLTGSGW